MLFYLAHESYCMNGMTENISRKCECACLFYVRPVVATCELIGASPDLSNTLFKDFI